jgi:hypothetical protein
MSETQNITTPVPGGKNELISRLSATVNPFAPLAFDITTGFQAAARIAIFAGASYFLWSKSRKAAYVTAGAAAVSLFTSLSAKHGV